MEFVRYIASISSILFAFVLSATEINLSDSVKVPTVLWSVPSRAPEQNTSVAVVVVSKTVDSEFVVVVAAVEVVVCEIEDRISSSKKD